MLESSSNTRFQYDVTGRVNLEDTEAVAAETYNVLRLGFPGFEDVALGFGAFLARAFADAEAAYWGKFENLIGCETPYHDLRHALDTALLAARMIDGYQRNAQTTGRRNVTCAEATLTVFLALFHDVGFIRRHDDLSDHGAQLAAVHEERGVEFVTQYLLQRRENHLWLERELADDDHLLSWARRILATKFTQCFDTLTEGDCDVLTDIARIIGSADLISQTADRCYLERCRDFLYLEMLLGSGIKTASSDKPSKPAFPDSVTLMENTPNFYRQSILRRLTEVFNDIDHNLRAHFAGGNPFRESMDRNHEYLEQLLAEGNLDDGLKRTPRPSIPEAP